MFPRGKFPALPGICFLQRRICPTFVFPLGSNSIMTNYHNPKLVIDTSTLQEGKVSWQSPSNLAIIKYWGKHGVQLPRNPSISFTLERAFTETTLYYCPRLDNSQETITLKFFFEDRPNEAFQEKIKKYLESLVEIYPFLRQLDIVIRSRNSFPHSSGIASSASSMSALALCLCSLEQRFFGTLTDPAEFKRKASYLARLGSGSACRSVYGTMSIWGKSAVEESSDLYAIPYEESIHPVFKTFHDDILIISKGRKSVSSRAGHALMDENIYAENRYAQARHRFNDLLEALKKGDVDAFGHIAEAEALTLHALMMTSNPPFILMKPNTLAIIDRIQQFRKDRQLPLFFSLDAGPNLHLLYPDSIAGEVKSLISEELLPFCEERQWIEDCVGRGPIQQ